MTATKQIPVSHICSMDESELKEFLVKETLLKIRSTDKDQSKGISVDRCSTDEDKLECAHKISTNKNEKNEAEYEESALCSTTELGK